eukprot:10026593-Lingulodinium_polyedra.AAC.1
MDSKWALPFKKKYHATDTRSLAYDGRLLLAKESGYVFKNTPIWQGRTDMAEMLPGTKMRPIED